jgi:UDP:flavonoid glycosyltransferase YjiC (YdhE family)
MIGMANPVLIQDLPPPYTISTTNYQLPEWLKSRFQYIGFIVRQTPEQLPERKTIREKLGVNHEPLIYAPLAGPIVARKQLYKYLTKLLKDFDGKVIISLGMYGKKIDKKIGNIEIKSWHKNRFELLKASDLTISRPGLATTGDFLRFGIPSLLIPTLNHPEQLYNAKSVNRLGVGDLIEQDDLTKEILLEKIQYLLNDKAVKRASKRMQKIMIKHDGLKKVKEIINQHLNGI